MKSFNHFLREKGVDNDVRSLLYHIARSVKYINFSIRAGNTGQALSQNTFGEEQLAMDVLADKIIMDELEKSELASKIVSEEQDECILFNAPRGDYLVAYDPLDGSSLVDANLAIGSIFGIWDNPEVLDKKVGENLIASCYAVYGPRITLTIAFKDKGVHEFELNDVGEFILTRENITIEAETKYFAPGNLKATTQDQSYKKLIERWMSESKTLRYSGGMVPDIHHILSKGQGIFCYPRDEKNLNGKLRLLFECAPFSFIFEEAGGLGLNQDGLPILDTPVEKYHQRTPIFVGSKSEVEKSVSELS